ncbi:hypothetical protein GALL_498170 [mine drainage metagenome]|uniref:Uncharacterized protein n=1 Tax=mine drainage metagenome TaxID=410659 RepID=A0A1J5PY84_9ZZZZ
MPLLISWANWFGAISRLHRNCSMSILQAFDYMIFFSNLDFAWRVYTMAHCLLRMPKDYRLPGVQSVMAKPPFLFRIQTTPWPHPPTEFISDRGNA